MLMRSNGLQMLVFSVALVACDSRANKPGATMQMNVDPEIKALGCKGTGAIGTMGDFMKNRISPITSRISFRLYHDRRDRAERFPVIAQEAGRMLNCLTEMSALRIEGSAGRDEHQAYLSQIQTNAFNLFTAAQEMEEEQARHWFGHLKQDCAQCHARFRAPAKEEVPAPGELTPR